MADKRETEFGGVDGLVAPLPHELTNYERLRLIRATDSTDPADNEDAALARERKREGR